MARHETDGAFYGHASVGCLHVRPMLDLRKPIEIERLHRISEEVCDLVIEFHGAMSGEHGDGLARSYLNERLFGSRIYEAFKQVKRAFDPHNRLNPGKVVDGPSPVENLRYGAGYRTLDVPTTFDFSREGGFATAVELCNGAGVCRKAADRHDVPLVHGHRATKNTAPAAVPTHCGWCSAARCQRRS